MLDALTQQFIETAGMPLIAKLEEDKNKMRILSNKFVRMEFADYYPSSFDTSDTDNLLTAIKLCKDKNVLENF